LAFAHQDIKGLFEIFSEGDNPTFVSGHDKNLLLRMSLTVNRRMISYAISGVPYATAFELVGARSRSVRQKPSRDNE
jgi:hypothetical protein